MKRILIGLGHPAHYHLFKNTAKILLEKHKVLFAVVDKDILIELLENSNFDYVKLSDKEFKHNFVGKLNKVARSFGKSLKIIKIFKPDIILTCLPQLIWSGFVFNVPRLFFGEDDFSITKIQGRLTYPFVSGIVAPNPTDVGPFKLKKNSYSGYQKLAYLHPNWFVPNRSKVNIPLNKRYFILRLSSLNAYHDVNAAGISNQTIKEIMKILLQHGKVLISSERELPEEFEKYRFNGEKRDIHHYLAFADLFIGDSQTMSCEAGLLGTPFIRSNNFVGKINYLDEIENRFNLGFGILPENTDELVSKVKMIVDNKSIKDLWRQRKEKLLEEKIDVTAFYVWFIENYPESKKTMKDNPNFQYKFK